MSGELIRCFVAIDVFTPEIVRTVTGLGRELEEAGLVGKVVDPESLHITLQFLGEIGKDLVERVKEELSRIEFRPFPIRLEGVGYFPGGGRINVVWIGVRDPSGELHRLQGEVSSRLGALGLRPDKEFRPHITFFRVKSVRNKPQVLEAITRRANFEVGELTVDRFKLKRSVLRPEGPLYSDLLVVRANRGEETSGPGLTG
ncbi:MAG: RNA 2',3'-cyclic phosphodiesterase [Nitrososphaerota archaeon]|nr:RNA 2',3'-cyclic phosphodiesterase [Candidatus Calditenuis fumarioli]